MFNDKTLILAPMAGISDAPMREICRSLGADYAVSEMISAKGLIYGDHKSRQILAPGPSDRPHWVQLFGSDPEIIRAAAQLTLELGADLIDINMGCPVKKVVKTGAGAALLKKPAQAAAIMKALNRPPAIPYTIKIRRGWKPDADLISHFINLAATHQARALTCHPRSAVQMFGGRADWERLLAAAAEAPLPIIGSGDLTSAAETAKVLAQPGISGAMLGRGVLGRPWLFKECRAAINGEAPAQPLDDDEKIAVILHHGRLLRHCYHEKSALFLFRKHLAWYSRGRPKAAAWRAQLFQCEDFALLEEQVREIFDS